MLRPALLAAIAALACERADREDPPPPAPPDAVVATISTGSLARAAEEVRAYAEAVSPGSGLMVGPDTAAEGLAQNYGATSLAGLDLAGPVHVIVLDGPARSVLVGRVKDRAALEKGRGLAELAVRDGWALLGPRDAIDLVASWAVRSLVATRPVKTVEATVFADRLMTRHAADLTQLREELPAQLMADPRSVAIMADYLTGLVQLAGDSARVSASLAVGGGRAELDVTLVPRASTRLAAFVAAQRPSDFSLLGSLPADAPTMAVMAGHLELGPYREAAITMLARTWNFDDGGGPLRRAFGRLADVATGDFAAGFSMSPGGISMVEVVPVSDPAAADRIVREAVAASASGLTVSSMGLQMTHRGQADAAAHGGTAIHRITTTVDLESVPAAQRDVVALMYGTGLRVNLAVSSGALLASIGEVDLLTRAIDARAGTADRLRPVSAPLVAQARARRDSALILVDLVALKTGKPADSAAGMAIALGFADRSAHLRLTIPAEALRAAAAPPGG